MHSVITRRSFLAAAGIAAGAAAEAPLAMAATGLGMRFGYAAITWGSQERQAIGDISAAGYDGIQLRNNALTEFQPAELREILRQHKLTFVALSSGEVTVGSSKPAETIAEHAAHAQYVKDAGGFYLQVLDQLKPYPRTVTPEECKQLGRLLTELGKRTAGVGIPLAYHNHMNTIGEHPGNLDLVLESSDPRYVHLLLDTAHSVAGGGNPAQAIVKYHERILFIHLKDVIGAPMTKGAKYPFEWVELGRGRVNLPAVFAALQQVEYRGWAVVELDKVPDKSRTPKECAMISRKYLEDKIGAKFS